MHDDHPTRRSAAGAGEAAGGLAAVVLAAGAGVRLRPLTRCRPKALCPIGNVALVDLAIGNVVGVVPVGDVAVNVHHHRDRLVAHFADGSSPHPGVHLSIEEEVALGTAGAIGHLRSWLDGRDVLVVNADTWSGADLAGLVAGWDRERVAVLVQGDERFGPRSRIVASLLPAAVAMGLHPVPSGLYEMCWRQRATDGGLVTVAFHGDMVDCGSPGDYLRANRLALRALAMGQTSSSVAHPSNPASSIIDTRAVIESMAVVDASVVGAHARVAGAVVDSVVWSGASVAPGERLDRAIRTDCGITVLVR